MRSKSRAALVLGLALALGSGCNAFVDLDGLHGGANDVDASADANADGAGSDAATNGDGARPTDGGGDANLSTDAHVEGGSCPSKGGPTPVLVQSGATRFCIDSSEVTNAQYEAFLETTPTKQAVPAFCGWNDAFTPVTFPFTPAQADFPVAVDWCDAYAFCKWAGKRLCGKVGGGAMTPGEASDGTKSELVFACSNGGTQIYPYGNVYTPNACNGGEGATSPHAAKALATCTGGFAGVYDLAGNMHEHLDSCVPGQNGFPSDTCYLQLSAWGHNESDMKCAGVEPFGRADTNVEVGFRCCSDAP